MREGCYISLERAKGQPNTKLKSEVRGMCVIFKTTKSSEITSEENAHQENKRTGNEVLGHVRLKGRKWRWPGCEEGDPGECGSRERGDGNDGGGNGKPRHVLPGHR